MYAVTIKYTRPNANTNWFKPSSVKYWQDLQANALACGDLVVSLLEPIDDVTALYFSIWKDKETLDRYQADPVIAAIRRMADQYNTGVGIVEEESTESVSP